MAPISMPDAAQPDLKMKNPFIRFLSDERVFHLIMAQDPAVLHDTADAAFIIRHKVCRQRASLHQFR